MMITDITNTCIIVVTIITATATRNIIIAPVVAECVVRNHFAVKRVSHRLLKVPTAHA
jgi:hypothetical protein